MKGFYTRFSLLFLLGTLFLFQIPNIQAQDPHFAQFYAAPLQTNPAMTGVFTGRFRVVANYREQWGSVIDYPFRTIGASFDMRHRIGKGDYVAYGLTALRDEAGLSNYVRSNGYLNAAYMKQLSGSRYRGSDQFLVAGAQVGFGQHNFDYSKLWFTNQFDLGTEDINFDLPSGELIGTTGSYLDFNAGLLYYAVFDDNASLYIGGSLHHLNAPKVSFLENSTQTLYMKWLGQIGGEVPFTRELSLLPAVLVMGQGPSFSTLFGGNFRYTNRDWREVAIRAGVWSQLSNQLEDQLGLPALIFTAILEMERLNIGISYDVNAGEIATPTNSRGAYEISLIYVHPATQRERVACPKF